MPTTSVKKNADAWLILLCAPIMLVLVLGLSLGLSGCEEQSGNQPSIGQGTAGNGTATASELVYYPAQTDVDPTDEYVYGEPVGVPSSVKVSKGEAYISRDEVALYIHTFGSVPPNFISKTKARNAGWVAEEGNLQEVLPGMCIGGGGWHNDDLVMPGGYDDAWYECDINYTGGYRGAERLVYSDNGMIFYTPDHYVSYARIF